MSRSSDKELPFNDRAIQAARYLGGRATEYRIRGVRGLVLYVYKSGRKVFHVHYDIRIGRRRARRKPRIGDYGETTLHAARARANQMLARVDTGGDPEEDRQALEAEAERSRFTFNDLVHDFLDDRRRRAVRSIDEIERVLRKDVCPALGRVQVSKISDLHIQEVVDRVAARGAPALAARVLVHLRATFNFARKNATWRHRGVTANPAELVERPEKLKHRIRTLDDAEIRGLLADLSQANMDPLTRIAITLILVTGQRPNEVSGMRRSELRLNVEAPLWRLPADRTKNSRPHTVPLSTLALDLISMALELGQKGTSSPFVFPNRDRPMVAPYTKGALSRALLRMLRGRTAPAEHFTIHDLRRTAATGLARLGTDRVVIAKILNHISEDRKSVTGLVYDQHDYEQEKRAALDAWATHLKKLGDRFLDQDIQVHP